MEILASIGIGLLVSIAMLVRLPPGAHGAVRAAFGCILLTLIAGPLLHWRVRAAGKRAAAGRPVVERLHRGYAVAALAAALGVAVSLATVALLVAASQYTRADGGEAALEGLRGRALMLDERLTMSARLAVATGDRRWEERYRLAERDLDRVFKDADSMLDRVLGDGVWKARAASPRRASTTTLSSSWSTGPLRS
jgi:hypothetical protein